tara:strand:- start:173 stop:919 length:747 start_codon:yes stop_codon:yes gene_type:complete
MKQINKRTVIRHSGKGKGKTRHGKTRHGKTRHGKKSKRQLSKRKKSKRRHSTNEKGAMMKGTYDAFTSLMDLYEGLSPKNKKKFHTTIKTKVSEESHKAMGELCEVTSEVVSAGKSVAISTAAKTHEVVKPVVISAAVKGSEITMDVLKSLGNETGNILINYVMIPSVGVAAKTLKYSAKKGLELAQYTGSAVIETMLPATEDGEIEDDWIDVSENEKLEQELDSYWETLSTDNKLAIYNLLKHMGSN